MITRFARMIVKFCEFDIHKENTQISLCVFFVLAPSYFPGQLPAKYLRRK